MGVLIDLQSGFSDKLPSILLPHEICVNLARYPTSHFFQEAVPNQPQPSTMSCSSVTLQVNTAHKTSVLPVDSNLLFLALILCVYVLLRLLEFLSCSTWGLCIFLESSTLLRIFIHSTNFYEFPFMCQALGWVLWNMKPNKKISEGGLSCFPWPTWSEGPSLWAPLVPSPLLPYLVVSCAVVCSIRCLSGPPDHKHLQARPSVFFLHISYTRDSARVAFHVRVCAL